MPGHPSRIELERGTDRAELRAAVHADLRVPPQDGPGPDLRADARHNRERILGAAREAFATRGLDVPMAAIARRAGVGVATLYRRFPSRESLVVEVFADQLTACASTVDDAFADPDPWRGFTTAIEKICAMQLADRGFATAFMTAFPAATGYEHTRAHAERRFAELVRRAKEAGRLRADFDPADLVLLLKAVCGVTADAGEAAAASSRRLVAYLLQSFEAGHTAPLPPPPPLDLGHLHPVAPR
ncbi:TetR/AcrR family transcriptional regulator [Nonomuraea fuscirosea]|jgi:AcrR family transcriptional regulator|uniref:TetR/AcrR family transcriptional regulator n=1 Tax=Nonomuraea fuscirosea TaxID=1291556 RepID=UPI002DDA66AC|nr:helix-turn-helix domain-containing protein [Nonomuraea fuscirosea]WSA57739.1 TetR/AcrR family transcriptional regulator [Nonomuraea fuscirosea]